MEFLRYFFIGLLNVIPAFILSSCDKIEGFPSTYEDTSVFLTKTGESEIKLIEIGGREYSVFSDKVFPSVGKEPLRPVFRIPSIVITNSGTMLVASENRDSYDDKGEIDIVLARKGEKDSDWEIRRIWQNESMTYGRSMNPVFVIDRIGAFGLVGRIFLFTCHIKQGVGYADTAKTDEFDIVFKYSDDDGLTWSSECSIKDKSDFSLYDIVIPSAANGIQMYDGTLIVPTMNVKDGQYHSGIVYMNPKKRQWIFSNTTPNNGDNECTVYFSLEGDTILDCRTTDYIRRKYSYIWDKKAWSLVQDPILVNLNLKVEITESNINGKRFFLSCFCDTNESLRENITLYGSLDAINWKNICLLQKGLCHLAYSNAACYNNKMAVVLETVDWGIRVIDLSDLSMSIANEIFNENLI